MEETRKSIAEFVSRARAKGYAGFELFVRVGEASQLVDEYAADGQTADLVWRDAVANANGFEDVTSSFFLKAMSKEGAAGPSRAFSVAREMGGGHQPDRFEGSATAMVRLLLEQNHRSHLAMVQTLQAVAASVQAYASSQSHQVEVQAQYAQTHSEALQALREGRADQARAERELLEANIREERKSKLIETGMALLPALLQSLGEDKKP